MVAQKAAQRKIPHGTRYVSQNIRRGAGTGGADDAVIAAAHLVADQQDQLGGIGGQEYRLPAIGMGVVEFYYEDSPGHWRLEYGVGTDFWKSDGKGNHAEWEVLRGFGNASGRTVTSILEDFLSMQGGQFDPSRWRIDISVVTGYPTCDDCKSEAGAMVSYIQSVLGSDTPSFHLELYGLKVENPNQSVLEGFDAGGIERKTLSPDNPPNMPEFPDIPLL